MTTFQTPFGPKRLVTLLMGWTNSVPIFHDDVTKILQPEIPAVTMPYIDDVPIKGPATCYELPGRKFETIPWNPGIRRFVWEHFQGANRVVQHMKYCGGTFLGKKTVLCTLEMIVVGHRCMLEGRLPELSNLAKVSNWQPCTDLSDVRTFLGTIGVARIFIKNFSKRAHHLVRLTHKDTPFEFSPDQLATQEDLKHALLASPALQVIDYQSPASVILGVDTSYIAIGYLLCQQDVDDPKVHRYARFSSITLNDREAHFSQPKLELYGLYRSLRMLKLWLIGIRSLIIKVDAWYISGMLNNPDLAPSTSMNHWIVGILMFQFTLVHVPGKKHGPDGLSRCCPQEDDAPELDDDFDDWVDRAYGFVHMINVPQIGCDCPQLAQQLISTNVAAGDVVAPPLQDHLASYADVPRSEKSLLTDAWLHTVTDFLLHPIHPDGLTDWEYARFLRYCHDFFMKGGHLWKCDQKTMHKLVLPPPGRWAALIETHESAGHRGVAATALLLAVHFWWPFMGSDVAWFVCSCHICQAFQIRKVLIPPTVAVPTPLFAKMYMDTMHLPKSNNMQYLVQGRCSVSHFPEWHMLCKERSEHIMDWIYQDILCRWGMLTEIVSDNSGPFVKALTQLEMKYHIRHIRISGYNSRANGIAEHAHFDVCQALIKAADGVEKNWSYSAHSVF
ncbi:hypothetical protein EWM64_g5561 [Hericium alpestre]|uniref:Integrase catalytic domain-containing protein n=1 Tax=Hericium alpestre TaxID=135208 RepID=A0A4Y9ZW89_9AGAM|nr:hypothetical protein EWM64_g5561 [Hericium alpestre]